MFDNGILSLGGVGRRTAIRYALVPIPKAQCVFFAPNFLIVLYSAPRFKDVKPEHVRETVYRPLRGVGRRATILYTLVSILQRMCVVFDTNFLIGLYGDPRFKNVNLSAPNNGISPPRAGLGVERQSIPR